MLELVIALSNFFSVSEYSFHGYFPDSAIVEGKSLVVG